MVKSCWQLEDVVVERRPGRVRKQPVGLNMGDLGSGLRLKLVRLLRQRVAVVANRIGIVGGDQLPCERVPPVTAQIDSEQEAVSSGRLWRGDLQSGAVSSPTHRRPG
jgi:hypothetical protein